MRSTCGPRPPSSTAALCAAAVDDRRRPRRGVANRSTTAAGSSVSASRSRSPIVSRRRRYEPAGTIRRDAGQRRRGCATSPSTIVAAPGGGAAGAARDSSRAMPSRISCSVRAESPRRPRSRPASAAARRSSSVAIPSSCTAGGRSSGPSPGTGAGRGGVGGNSAQEPLVVRRCRPVVASSVELVGDRLADARDRPAAGRRGRPRATSTGRPPDGVRGPVVGDGLEHELALDLEHVADLVEDLRELPVREEARYLVGLVGAKVGRDLIFLEVEVGGLGHAQMVATPRSRGRRAPAARLELGPYWGDRP